jgi:ribonucleoside-diphosphate reductase alpha chain
LGAIIVTNCKTEEQYQEAAYNILYMIDFCIDENDYPLPHMKLTAQARRNAGVGIMDLAHHMALKGLKYNTKAGLEEMHRVAERHMYWLIQASMRLGRERGNAPWIHKTDWPRGWTPLKTYSREVDKLGDFVNVYDWDQVSADLIAQGGQRNSSLGAHMPGESSSKYSACTNSLMGLRYLSITKKDGSNAMEWVAPEADRLKDDYTIMWTLTIYEQINFYAVFQKWTDQSISADFYAVIKGNDKFDSYELVKQTNYASDMGIKTWYYTNVETSDQEALKGSLVRMKRNQPMFEDDGLDLSGPVCTSGGCSV